MIRRNADVILSTLVGFVAGLALAFWLS